MDGLLTFFETNTTLVFFVYGLVFFVLGLVIALQSWRHTRLELARSLRWLAAFGLIHGIHEWGTIFIPLQSAYVSTATLDFLLFFQLFTLAISYVCLFQFGADLFRDRWSWLTYMPIVAFTFWLLIFVAKPILSSANEAVFWQHNSSIWARYLLGFPGGMLAAFGLRYQANRQIKPLNLPHIYRMLQIAGWALGAYGILSGLIVPPGDFWPANWLNSVNLTSWLGVPAPVFRSLAGLVITVTIIQALDVFNVEIDRHIEEMKVTNSLLAERERIGRELHDGAIQQVYTAGLLIESVQKRLPPEKIEQQRLGKAMNVLNEAIASLRVYMGDLRSEETAVALKDGLQEKTNDPALTALMNVALQIDLPPHRHLTPSQTKRVLGIVSEALANSARHSQAHHVWVHAYSQDRQLILTVKDDGVGFVVQVNGQGYGLRDMRDQARLLHGELRIETQVGQGTAITLTVPWEEQ